MKGIRVGCVPGAGRESPADDDSFYDYHGRENKEYCGLGGSFIPYLPSFLVTILAPRISRQTRIDALSLRCSIS